MVGGGGCFLAHLPPPPPPQIPTPAHRSGCKGTVQPKNRPPTVATPPTVASAPPRSPPPPLRSTHVPSIKLKLASLNRGKLLMKPTARRSFENNSPGVIRLCLMFLEQLWFLLS